MRIAGIDVGTSVIAVGLCTETGELFDHLIAEPDGVEKRRKRYALDRFWPLMQSFWRMIEEQAQPDYCYIEEMIYAGSFTATASISMVAGGIAVILHQLDIPFSFVSNSVWKKGLIGRGNATKDEIRAWVRARYNLPDGLCQDIYDAVAIASWGSKNFAPRPPSKCD